MSIFAEVGNSVQQVGGDLPSGWVVMQGERPSPEHVAQADGTWVIPTPPPPTREQIEAQRLRAYADPLTGSDRFFAEEQRETLMGNTAAADAAKRLGMARFAEIQAEHPWPTA